MRRAKRALDAASATGTIGREEDGCAWDGFRDEDPVRQPAPNGRDGAGAPGGASPRLSREDCPDCGGPLLDTRSGPALLTLACPGCGYRITWPATHPDDSGPADGGEREAA
jgi:hypothetical protein